MKNQEIIATAAVMAGIMTAEEAKKCVESGAEIPMHTVQGWKLRGNYYVKDGEDPVEVKLWKKKECGGFYLAKAYLYSIKQMVLDD